MTKMTDKIALVVGGASGIGLAVARRLAAEGGKVSLTSRRAADVEAAASDIGNGARGIVANAAEPAELERITAEVLAEHGRLDVLVLNAGISEPGSLAETTTDFFDRHFDVNVRGPVFAMKAAAPIMSDGGSVVLIGSIADVIGSAVYGTYGSTKAALRSYARSWAAELAPRAIRVNVVSPGPTETAMFAAVPDDARAAMTAQIPLGRLARVDEVASAAVFLLSDEASFITGAELCVDGGMKQI